MLAEVVDPHSTPMSPPGKQELNHSVRASLQAVAVVLISIITAHSVWTVYRYADKESDFDFRSTETKSDAVALVWASGWITAVATGVGAVPFFFLDKLNLRLVAKCNAVAAGMMLAASLGLVLEGCFEEYEANTIFIPPVKVMVGCYTGVGFVKLSSFIFGEESPSDLLGTLSMKRVFIIMAVMTLHSFSEGVGIGVSYHSETLGSFISATLAIHNIPEGVAVSIVLIPRGFSKLTTTLWCIFSSLPQPLMAVPAFLFVDQFKSVTPLGFGFAAGAMCYVAVFELIDEALETLKKTEAYTYCAVAIFTMGSCQYFIRDSFQ